MPETSEVVSVKEGIQVCGRHDALLVCMQEGTSVPVYGCEGRGHAMVYVRGSFWDNG